MSRRAIFLDRDGTINEDFGYLSDPAQVNILPGVIQALALLAQNGWLLVIISNQSGVGRGYYSMENLQAVQDRKSTRLNSSH